MSELFGTNQSDIFSLIAQFRLCKEIYLLSGGKVSVGVLASPSHPLQVKNRHNCGAIPYDLLVEKRAGQII